MSAAEGDTSGSSAKPVASESRWIVRLIILTAAILQLVRILHVQSSTGEVPFLSANDRSRWCTIAALAVNGDYVIDDVLEIRDPKTKRRTWYTIDLVRHRGADGKQHYYSSKPPLLPTLYTGVYLAIRGVTGLTLMSDPFAVAKWMLVLVNLLPLLAFWWLLMRWAGRELQEAWSVVLLAFFVGWGTYLSTFVNTLNNHLPAAMAVGVSLWCLDRILLRKDVRVQWFVLCGLCTSFGAANELPALSWVCAAGSMLAIVDWKRFWLAYVPSLVPVAAAFFLLNFAAHGVWVPAYGHRDVGRPLAEVQVLAGQDGQSLDLDSLVVEVRKAGFELSDDCELRVARRPQTFELWDATSQARFALKPIGALKSGESISVRVHEWDDWYDYPSSYWVSDRKQGVDRGEPSRARYVFHCLVGHHGVFSLTPFWLLSILGVIAVVQSRKSWNIFGDYRLLLTAAIVATTVVVLTFYFSRGLEDRNYGGVNSGFRWTIWLIPMWLWLAMSGLERCRSVRSRRLVEVLLLASIFSANYAWDNPWVSPWLMEWFTATVQ